MATWSDLVDEIYALTNRPDLSAETALALRQAVRLAHKSGTYWRDLAETTISDTSGNDVLQWDLSTVAPNFRGTALITDASNLDWDLKAVTIADLLDADGYYQQNVYWGVGTYLKLRTNRGSTSFKMTYYKYPIVFPTASFNSWIADHHSDLLILMAASQVLGSVGEDAIKARLDALIPAELTTLKNSNIEIVRR